MPVKIEWLAGYMIYIQLTIMIILLLLCVNVEARLLDPHRSVSITPTRWATPTTLPYSTAYPSAMANSQHLDISQWRIMSSGLLLLIGAICLIQAYDRKEYRQTFKLIATRTEVLT